MLALSPDCAAFFNTFVDLQNCMVEVSLKPADPPRLTIRTTGTTKMYKIFLSSHLCSLSACRAFDVFLSTKFAEAELQVRESDGAKWNGVVSSQVCSMPCVCFAHLCVHRRQ